MKSTGAQDLRSCSNDSQQRRGQTFGTAVAVATYGPHGHFVKVAKEERNANRAERKAEPTQ